MNIHPHFAMSGAGKASWVDRAKTAFAGLFKAIPGVGPVLTRTRTWVQILLVSVLVLAGGAAQAYQCGGGYALDATIPIATGSTVITTSQPVSLNNWVGDWSPYSYTYRNWWCYASPGDVLQPQLKGTTGFASPASVTIGGVTYAVFSTGVAGLGVVFQWHPIYSLADSNGNRTALVQEVAFDVPLTNAYTTATQAWNFNLAYQPTDIGIAISARYVMIGTITPGAKLPAVASATIGTSTIVYNGTSFGTNNITRSQSASTFTVLGCTPVSSVTVPMGTYGVGSLSNAGSSTGKTNFNIALTGCPAGMGGIMVSLHPVNGRQANGILQLAQGVGAATGVGVQITKTGTSSPVLFDAAFLTNSGYSGSAGNYNIPLTATYVNTGGTGAVTPGVANTQLEYTITYQ